MLRIKESEWQRFCDNAEELDVTHYKFKIFYYINANTILLRITFDEIRVIEYNKTSFEKLYDLIQQGYVEKVEE